MKRAALCLALCVSLTACAGTVSVEEAFREDIDGPEQADIGGETVFRALCGEDILAVAREVYADGEAIAADIYQYVDGETRFIASVASTGTAYPLAYADGAILFSGNHMSGKLRIEDGAGKLEQITNVNIEGRTPLLETYDIRDGEATLISSEEIPEEEAYALDWYANAFAEETAKILLFQS